MLRRREGFLYDDAVIALHAVDAMIDPARMNGRTVPHLFEIRSYARVELFARFRETLASRIDARSGVPRARAQRLRERGQRRADDAGDREIARESAQGIIRE